MIDLLLPELPGQAGDRLEGGGRPHNIQQMKAINGKTSLHGMVYP